MEEKGIIICINKINKVKKDLKNIKKIKEKLKNQHEKVFVFFSCIV